TRASLLKAKVVVPGKSGKGVLIERVTEKDPKKRMPPKGKPLSEKEVALLRAWIDQGVAWQEGVSFAKPRYVAPPGRGRPTVPPARAGRTTPADRVVDGYFAKRKLKPPAPLEDGAFVRRVYLDLVGLLPTPEQQEAFLADTRKDRRARLVRKLLDDRRA